MLDWNEVSAVPPPTHTPLETWLIPEEGTYFCSAKKGWPGQEDFEWYDRYGNDTVVHSTFLKPSHWRYARFCEPPAFTRA